MPCDESKPNEETKKTTPSTAIPFEKLIISTIDYHSTGKDWLFCRFEAQMQRLSILLWSDQSIDLQASPKSLLDECIDNEAISARIKHFAATMLAQPNVVTRHNAMKKS